MLTTVYISLMTHNMWTQLKEHWHMPGTVVFAKIIRETDSIYPWDKAQFDMVCARAQAGPSGKPIGLVDPKAVALLYRIHARPKPRSKFMRHTVERMVVKAWLHEFPGRALPPADRYVKKAKAE